MKNKYSTGFQFELQFGETLIFEGRHVQPELTIHT